MTPWRGNCGACLSKRFVDDVAFGFRATLLMGEVLGEIARGRPDGGRPINSEAARQKARDVLTELGLTWPKHEPERKR